MVVARHSIRLIFLAAGILHTQVSCLKDMPRSEEDLPHALQWNPDLAFPLGKDSFGMNQESGFDSVHWEPDTNGIPKWVNELEVVMAGKVDIDLSSMSQNLDDVDQILFRLNMYNGFPHEMSTQAYFMGADGNPVDSMFESGAILVNPGGITGNGEIIDPAVLRSDVIMDQERIDRIWQVTEILFRAVIRDVEAEEIDTAMINYYHNYHFDLDVGMMVSLSLEL